MGLSAILLEAGQQWWWCGLLLLLVARLAYNYSRLSFIPGPFLASVSDIWRYFHGRAGQCVLDYELHRKYNTKLLRVGPNQISVSDPKEIPKIYGLNPIFNKVCQLAHTRRYGSSTGSESDLI